MPWAAVYAVGVAITVDASRKAAKAQKEQGKVQAASQKIEDASRLRKQAREARIQRARILAQSEATGATGSSAQGGALSSLGTQLNTNVSRVAGQAQTADALTELNSDLADAKLQGAYGSAIASVGNAGGGLNNLFE
jgi:hypothetical protein